MMDCQFFILSDIGSKTAPCGNILPTGAFLCLLHIAWIHFSHVKCRTR